MRVAYWVFACRADGIWGELTFFKKQHTIAVFASPAVSHQTARDLLARVVKLVDAGDSKSPAARRAGSIPAPGTIIKSNTYSVLLTEIPPTY